MEEDFGKKRSLLVLTPKLYLENTQLAENRFTWVNIINATELLKRAPETFVQDIDISEAEEYQTICNVSNAKAADLHANVLGMSANLLDLTPNRKITSYPRSYKIIGIHS